MTRATAVLQKFNEAGNKLDSVGEAYVQFKCLDSLIQILTIKVTT